MIVAGLPTLRVVRGDATPEEIAALVAVLAARAAAVTPPKRAAAPGWADRGALLRRPHHPGPGAWRASGQAR
jgi:hypothetical protein